MTKIRMMIKVDDDKIYYDHYDEDGGKYEDNNGRGDHHL